MTKQKSIFFFILFFLFVFSFWGQSAFGQSSDRPLEIQYPSFLPTAPPQTVKTPVPNYVKYLYYFFIFTAGFFALGSLVYGGFRYITSAGSADAMKDAKDQISAALLGVLILVSSWVILNQINPQLTVFRLGLMRPFIPSLPPGVLLCKERVDIKGAWDKIKESETFNKEFETASPDRQKEIIAKLRQISNQVNVAIADLDKKCWKAPSSGDIPDPFNDKVEWVYLIPSLTSAATSAAATAGSEYGAILYEKTKFSGKSLAFYTLHYPNLQPSEWSGSTLSETIKDLHPSSIKPFILNYEPQPRPVWDVTLYELIDYNKAGSSKWSFQPALPSPTRAAIRSSIGASQKIGSLKREGSLIVIFFKQATTDSESSWQGDIDIFTESDTNLNDNLMGSWCGAWPMRFPCAPGGIVIISGSIY